MIIPTARRLRHRFVDAKTAQPRCGWDRCVPLPGVAEAATPGWRTQPPCGKAKPSYSSGFRSEAAPRVAVCPTENSYRSELTSIILVLIMQKQLIQTIGIVWT